MQNYDYRILKQLAILFLCLHEAHTVKAQVGVQIILRIFLTPEIDGSVRSVSFSVQALYPLHGVQAPIQ